jgi:dimeric dUTPase (all-alpha-NTP-PPase superfamily)
LNLKHLFELQAKLDERIYKEHPVQEGEDRLSKKILALQVELGELANEWRGFKYWSNDQKPRTELWKDCNFCGGRGFVNPANFPYGHQRITCIECRGESQFKTNPLLEEYVDCLHFFLSIGNDLWISQDTDFNKSNPRDVMTLFALINRYVAELWWEVHDNTDGVLAKYYFGFQHYLRLGEMLGFTWDEIEQGYLSKNKINHERQESGY